MNFPHSVEKKAKIQIQGLDLRVHMGCEDSSPLVPTYKHSFLWNTPYKVNREQKVKLRLEWGGRQKILS